MAQFDLVITGGTIVEPHGETAATLAVKDGRIAIWAAPGISLDARDRIDASGSMVLPGAIDAHVHMREPGLVHKEGFASGSRAAAAGGVTTMLVMPTDAPLTCTPQEFEDKVQLAEAASHIDFGLQAMALDTRYIHELADLGAASFELFLGDVPPGMLTGDVATLASVIAAVSNCGLVTGVTSGDDAVVAQAVAREHATGAKDHLSFFRSRPPLSEALGVAKACLAARATGGRVHVRQVSCGVALDIVRDTRQRYSRVSAEVTPHNLLLAEDEIERQGPYAKVLPPLRPQADLDALWNGLVEGSIDIVASDHAPHTPDEKRAGLDDIWKAPGGFPGVQTLLPLLLDAVATGRLSWRRLVEVCAEAPARVFGLYPRKGTLLPGADADIVIVDPLRRRPVRNEDQLSKADITPFAGRELQGWPVMTILRGQVVMRDGVVEGKRRGAFVMPRRG